MPSEPRTQGSPGGPSGRECASHGTISGGIQKIKSKRLPPARRLPSKGDENGGSDDDFCSSGTPSVQTAPQTNYACPFFKADPLKYRQCGLRCRLTHVNYVKQHLTRSHARPLYCQRCGETVPNISALQRHASQTTPCTARELSLPREGLDKDKLHEVSLLRRGDPVQRWYSTWDVIFPDRERPASPYITGDGVSDIMTCIFRRFSVANSDKLAYRMLERVPSLSLNDGRAILSDVFSQLEHHLTTLNLDDISEGQNSTLDTGMPACPHEGQPSFLDAKSRSPNALSTTADMSDAWRLGAVLTDAMLTVLKGSQSESISAAEQSEIPTAVAGISSNSARASPPRRHEYNYQDELLSKSAGLDRRRRAAVDSQRDSLLRGMLSRKHFHRAMYPYPRHLSPGDLGFPTDQQGPQGLLGTSAEVFPTECVEATNAGAEDEPRTTPQPVPNSPTKDQQAASSSEPKLPTIAGPINCEYCNHIFISPEEAANHQVAYKYFCTSCQRHFVSRKDLNRHVATVHENENKATPCSVPGCNYSSKRLDNLRRHVRNMHFELEHSDQQGTEARQSQQQPPPKDDATEAMELDERDHEYEMVDRALGLDQGSS